MSINVVVAVRHPIMRRGVCAIIADSAGLIVASDVGDLSSFEEACVRLRPGLGIIDNSLIRLQKAASMQTMIRRHPACKFILLSLYDRPGDLRKEQSVADLGLKFEDSDLNYRSISETLAQLPLQKISASDDHIYDPLTAREDEVLQNIAQGYTNAEIAGRLRISVRTTELHRYRIYRKLGVSSPLELAKFLIRQGLVPL